ncbi:hypothetical protein [Arthrobacter sp. StoSoilB22]|uniref:hypothetical protein n=1 Tax=Arthrobacter sp. StoSoilB22 TaxID=2830996 RepID=UPI001CC4727F|nr:hypothetical protein [Arthrobacter sp. StoSoilB22]
MKSYDKSSGQVNGFSDALEHNSASSAEWTSLSSRRLKAAPWGDFPPSNLESGDAIEAIRRIKRQSAKDAVRLVVTLGGQGSGRGVFPAGHNPALLKLQEVNSYDQGLVELSYTVRKRP